MIAVSQFRRTSAAVVLVRISRARNNICVSGRVQCQSNVDVVVDGDELFSTVTYGFIDWRERGFNRGDTLSCRFQVPVPVLSSYQLVTSSLYSAIELRSLAR